MKILINAAQRVRRGAPVALEVLLAASWLAMIAWILSAGAALVALLASVAARVEGE
jgi:hypothetical protein